MELSVLDSRTNAEIFTNNSSINIFNIFERLKSTVFHPEVIKPLVIINLFFLLQVLSGTYLIVFYGVDIIRDIGKQFNNIIHFLLLI